MGPRLFSRGNPSSRGIPSRLPRPSMGPRLFSRGNVKTKPFPALCGLSFNGAATLQSRKSDNIMGLVNVRGRLQWGRDSSVAEMTVD